MSNPQALLSKMMRIMEGYVSLEVRDNDTIEFHMEDGAIITMTLKTEHRGAGTTQH
tara:strand:+ start:1712 stop:1879 length:168 start_codon:yes stop_codon:yes gene_type:complete